LKLTSYFRENNIRPGIIENGKIIDIGDCAISMGLSTNDQESLKDISAIIGGGQQTLDLLNR